MYDNSNSKARITFLATIECPADPDSDDSSSSGNSDGNGSSDVSLLQDNKYDSQLTGTGGYKRNC